MTVNIGEKVVFILKEDGTLEEPPDDFDDFERRAVHGVIVGVTDYYASVEIFDESCPSPKRTVTVAAGDYEKLCFHNAEFLPSIGPRPSA